MKKVITILLFSFLVILSSCGQENPANKSVTEEEAKEIVIDCHSGDVGEINIVSVVTKKDVYVVKWENEPLKEGVDSVDKKTGKLKMIESSHGSCEWK